MLIEREGPLETLINAAHGVHEGIGAIALVSGDEGIGKTALLEQFNRELSGEHKIIWSGCEPLFTPRPFGPVYDFAISYSNKLLALLDQGASPAVIFAAFYEALEQAREPIVIVIEDAHWADHATLDLLKYLARRISFVNCLIVISFRDGEVDEEHPLRQALALIPAAHSIRLELQPLSKSGVEQLAPPAITDIEHLYKITAGNPFFVTELLATDDTMSNSVPASVQEAINSRLVSLVPDERKFLETISIIPNAITPDLIAALIGIQGETIAMACVARKLLVLSNKGRFRFRHELARLGTLARVSITEQSRLHGKMVRALEALPRNPDYGSLVQHSVGALDAKRVLKYTRKAADDAAALGAHREAASYLATALRFVDSASTEVAAELYETWAYEAGLALRIDDEVIEARRHAITLWRALGRKEKIGENLRWLSRLHWYRGEAAQASHFADEAINILESTPPSSERATAYSLRSQLDMLNDRMDDAIRWGERALELEKEYPSLEVRVHALNNIGSALVLRGNQTGEGKLKQSLELALTHGLHEHAARAYTNLSDYAVRYRKLEFAEQIIADGIAFDTQFDLDSWTYYLIGIQALLRLEQGRLRDAETVSLGVLKLKQLTLLMRLPASIVLAKAQLRLGVAEYKETLRQSLDNSFATDEAQYIVPARFAAIEAAWLYCDENAAHEHLRFLIDLRPDTLDQWQLGELTAWINRFDFDLHVDFNAELPEPYRLELNGDCEAAAEQWISLGLPYNAAITLLQSPADRAPTTFPKAYSILESIHAKTALSKLRRDAKAQGLHDSLPKARRGPYKASRQHPLGLTNKEQEILGYILEGASNQQISERLSRSQRTIENHVSSILSKLNVNNRLEAMLRVQNEPWLNLRDGD